MTVPVGRTHAVGILSERENQEPNRRGRQFLRLFLQTRLVAIGLIILAVVTFAAIFANLIAPYPPNEQDYQSFLQPPSAQHLLGTDDLGRDVLSRVIFGARVSIQVGVVAVGLALVLGVTLGLVAGYVSGISETLIMRFVDAIQAFPGLILALAITAALGPSLRNVMIAIGITSTPIMARLTRGQVLSVREREYVAAARVIGASPARILFRHIWPNTTAPVVVQATLRIATAIVTEASLSFLGAGVPPPTASWGSMLRSGSQVLGQGIWLSTAPGIAIFVTVLAFNFVGDGLLQALNPRLARRAPG
mgnify:CR=1 FL=1